MEDDKEEIFATRLSKKEETAWKELFELYSGRLTYVCLRYVIDRDEVDDIIQNSFILMFRSIDSFQYRGRGSLKAWVTKIVVNESLKQIKKNAGSTFISQNTEIPDEVQEDDPDLTEVPHQIILQMIRSLPEGYRTVFNLFVFEGKSHKEIGKILGIAENSSASQFHRAKSILARKINDYRIIKSAQYE